MDTQQSKQKLSREVFVVKNEDGEEICSLSVKDMASKPPTEFQLIKPKGAKKGTKPCCFVFTTQERVAKHSRFVEDWKTFQGKGWLKDGKSVERVNLTDFQESITSKDLEAKVSGKNRFECARNFLNLTSEEKQVFSTFPKDFQVRVLKVSKKLQAQIRDPKCDSVYLTRYAEWVSNTKERRMDEKRERRKREQEDHEKLMREIEIERGDLTERGDIGYEGYRHLRTPYSFMNIIYGSEESEVAEIPVTWDWERTSNTFKKVKKLLERLEEARGKGFVNRDICHRIYFWWCISYIRSEKALGHRHKFSEF